MTNKKPDPYIDDKLIKKANKCKDLYEEEKIYTIAEGIYVHSSSRDHHWDSCLLIITSKRVIFFKPGVFGDKLEIRKHKQIKNYRILADGSMKSLAFGTSNDKNIFNLYNVYGGEREFFETLEKTL